MRILLIEDNMLITTAIERSLRDLYIVDIAKDGRQGLNLAQSKVHDVILLDLNLPDISGQEICEKLRKEQIETPIIIISGRDDITDKVDLLDMGANDYITKPFNLRELRARINVAIRHISNGASGRLLIVQDLELDPVARTVCRAKKLIALRKKEFDLLEYLIRNQGMTLTRQMIMEHIWDTNENLWANVVDVHIKHLRDKIDRPFESKLIRTVHGIGYKLESTKQTLQ